MQKHHRFYRLWRSLRPFCLLLLSLPLLAATAQTPPPVTVTILPEQIELATGGQAKATVLVRNQGTLPITDVAASPFTNLPLTTTLVPTTTRALAAGETAVYTLTLTTAETISTGPLFIRVAYRQPATAETASSPSTSVAGVAHGMATVTGRTPPAAEELITATVETALERLNEQQPGTLYLMLHNGGDTAVSLQQITPRGPAFVTVAVEGMDRPISLGPGENTAVPVHLQAGDVIRPGRHLLLFEIDLAWRQGGGAYSDNLILTHPIQVGVLGESDLLTVLAVPSFLFLPGFLMVLTVGLLWKLSQREEEFPLKNNTPEAWLVAITLSILVAFAYPWATERFTGVRRDYLQGYGLVDVLFVWFSAIVLATVAYVGGMGARNLIRQARRYLIAIQTARHTPNRDDDPLAALQKLHRQGLGVYLERAKVTLNGDEQIVFLLQPRSETAETIWIAPPIIIIWRDNADLTLRRDVERLLNEEQSAATLATLLAQGQDNGDLSISWRRRENLRGPEPLPSEEIQTFIAPDVIVEQE